MVFSQGRRVILQGEEMTDQNEIITTNNAQAAITAAWLTFDVTEELQRDPHIRSPHTRANYAADLARFDAWRAGRSLTKGLVEEYAAHLQRVGYAPRTINRALAAVRWWIRRRADRVADLAATNPTQRGERDEILRMAARVAMVEDVDGSRPQVGRHIPAGELEALLRACHDDPGPAGLRDGAMIALAYSCGLRRAEVAGLILGDITRTSPETADLVIHGKGEKARVAFVYNGAHTWLIKWLAMRGPQAGALFCEITRWAAIKESGISGEAMRQALEKRRAAAGVNPLTWHDFRRTFATDLLGRGCPLVVVQKLMGHSSPTTTGGYDRSAESTWRAAVRELYVPFWE